MNYGLIYKITNLITKESYVGQTTNSLEKRFASHCNEKRNRHISNAIRKYGKENFNIEVICFASNQEELNSLEVKYVEQFNTMYPKGYNHRAGGNQKGICSQELKCKISLSKKGKPNFKRRGEIRSLEQRSKISKSLGGNKIKATNLTTGESFILETAHEGKKYGFNPSNIVSICKKHGRRFKTKNHTFEYISQANQSGSTEIKNSEHAQRIGIETAEAE